jgi:branched-subunit amino acid transport protein
MSTPWTAVLAVGAATMLIKAVGPVGVAHRRLPGAVERLLDLVAPAILAALVIVETFASGRHLVVDARLAGVGAGIACVSARAPFWLVVLCGALATAGVRALH